MDIVAFEITVGNVSVWPTRGGIRSSSLSYKYGIIQKNSVKNWMPAKHSTIVRTELALLMYNVGTKGYFDFGKFVFYKIVKQCESQKYKKPLCYPSLIFGVIESQANVLLPTDIYEVDSPSLVITDKLNNSVYHVNDIPESISTDSTVVTAIPLVVPQKISLTRTYKERVAREISMEVDHLSKLIESSQLRKHHLEALLSELQKDADLCHTVDKTGGDTHNTDGEFNAEAEVEEGEAGTTPVNKETV